MVASQLGRGRVVLAGLAAGVLLTLFSALGLATPARATTTPQVETTATSIVADVVPPNLIPGRGADEKVCTTGDGLAGAIGYIICPFTQIIADATAFFEKNILVPFMTISPLTTNEKNATYILWQNMRNLANIGFILFFFFIILSQATSIGLSNYGIKKILPRLLIVAIGINLSYFIVAFIIDAFNIFGAGISQLVLTALQQGGIPQTSTGTSASTGQSIFVIGGVLLAAVVATAGAAIGWLFGLIGIAFLFVLVTVIVLIIRQIAIIMLVIIAPVAILMYMLPNTENYFSKWRKNLTQLLMMYPIMVLLFAAGKIFAVLINQPDFKIGILVHGFASILAEPFSLLAQATGGTPPASTLSDQTVQGVKVGLSFIANATPLGATPLAWTVGGMVTAKAGSLLHGKLVAPKIASSKEKASLMGKEAQMRAAKVPGVGIVAGRGLRKKATLDARMRNLQSTQEEYVADKMSSSAWMRRQASGVAGATGRTRAAASAAGVAAKGRKEDIDNEMALLDAEMRRLGTNPKAFSSAIAKYLENPNDASAQTFKGSNGQEFNFKTQGAGLQRALLNSAASQGEVKAIEAARMSSNVDQTVLDDIIRANDGKLKEKGGYHLATNFNLGQGRMIQTDGSGRAVLDADGNTQAIKNLRDMKAEMAKQRVIAMAQSGANSVAGMKAGILDDTAKIITNDTSSFTNPDQIADRLAMHAAITTIDPQLRTRLRETATKIAGNAQTMARSEASEDTIRDIGSI